jgi:uncharacterized protein with PIN domain
MRYWIAPHLAFLVQWLRVLGIDVRLWDKGTIIGREEEETLIQWARYPLPVIGRKTPIMTLSSSTRKALLKEFFKTSGYPPNLSQMFRRCLRCNHLLVPLTPEEAKNQWPDLPAYVFQTQKRFNWCDRCQQLFWAGTHVRNMIRILEDWGVINPQPACEHRES